MLTQPNIEQVVNLLSALYSARPAQPPTLTGT